MNAVTAHDTSGRDFLAGGGEMGEHIRALDWSGTPLGTPETWSVSLRMMVSLLLANRFPMLLWWGPQYIQIYNDAYRPVLGSKHPQYLGRPVRECWSEIFDVIGPLIDKPFHGGPSTWMEDIELEVNRHGYLEESHFTPTVRCLMRARRTVSAGCSPRCTRLPSRSSRSGASRF